MAIFLQLALHGVLAAAVYGLIAGGLSFLYATTRIFHLAHGVVVLFGGYAFWWAWKATALGVFFSVCFAIVIAVAAGLCMNKFVYEKLRRQGTRGLGYLIATLALLMLGTSIILAIFGAAPKTFQFDTATYEIAGVTITAFQSWVIVIALAVLGVFLWILHHTELGNAMRATADNELTAEILGIHTARIRRIAFALSSALAALAGMLIGLEFNLDPNMGVLLAVKGFAATVIGGVGSFGGALLGALIIGGLEQVVVWYLGAGWRNAVTFIALFILLLLRPQGIFGTKRDA